MVGSGISGLCAAYGLRKRHDVTVFEVEDRVGGHAHTVPVETANGVVDVDTGFIVFNRRNYPLFSALLDQLAMGGRLVGVDARTGSPRGVIIDKAAAGFSERSLFDAKADVLEAFRRAPGFVF